MVQPGRKVATPEKGSSSEFPAPLHVSSHISFMVVQLSHQDHASRGHRSCSATLYMSKSNSLDIVLLQMMGIAVNDTSRPAKGPIAGLGAERFLQHPSFNACFDFKAPLRT